MDVSAPIELSEVQEARSENIIEIALDFSGMLRVFEEGSNVKIIPKLRELFKQLDSINEKAAYDSAHAEFCNWFVANIRTAQKKLKSGGIKASGACSYGHGAKVLDIAAKVYVYYSGQPSTEIAGNLLPMLHCALDTPMMLLLDSAKATIQEVATATAPSAEVRGNIVTRLSVSVLRPALKFLIYRDASGVTSRHVRRRHARREGEGWGDSPAVPCRKELH
jgi:hypothetical protein